jgi:hypothetical protein
VFGTRALPQIAAEMATPTTNVPDTMLELSNQIQGLYQERVSALDATYESMNDWLQQVQQEVPEKYKR